MASNAELEARFLRSQKAFGVSQENVEKQLRWMEIPSGCENLRKYFRRSSLTCDDHTRFAFENGRFLYGFAYLPRSWHTLGPDEPRWDIPEEKIVGLISRYDDLRADFQDLEADYVYYGPWEKNLVETNLIAKEGLELIYKNPEVEIYKIKK